MAMTMASKPFNENSMRSLVHVVHTPHPPPPSRTLANQHGRTQTLRQEPGVNGGGGMGSPVMKGRVLEGGPGAHDSRSLPNLGEGTFSHMYDTRGQENFDYQRRKEKYGRMRTMPNAPLTRSSMSHHDDEKPKQFNPDPMPFQSSGFKSSTLVKKVPMPRRHQDMWAGSRSTPDLYLKTKGFILHTDRYQSTMHHYRHGKWNDTQRPPADGSGPMSYSLNFNQRDRMSLEQEYMDRMKVFKRRREIMQHREPIDLLLGGEKCSYTERMDITGELNKLKSVVLPKKAKDLYVGRGFKLPQTHALNHPRPRATFAPTSNVPSFARNLSRMPSTIRYNTKVNLSKTKPSNSNSIKPQTLEMDNQPKASRTSFVSRDSLGNKKSEQDNDFQDEIPTEENGKWSKNKEDTEPGDTVIDINETHRPESEMDIKLADDQSHANKHQANHYANQNSSSPTKSASPTKRMTPNPLKATNVKIEAEQMDALRQTFKRLDTDMDGHVMFNQLKSQVPDGLTIAQERFIKLVYDITSSSTFFGIEEFVAMTELLEVLANLTGPCFDCFQTANFTSLEESISQYIELFTTVDRTDTGKISAASLRGILATAVGTELDGDRFMEVQSNLQLDISSETEPCIGKLQFLAHIPYFLSLEIK